MFNAKAYLEQILVKKLETWIDNFNGSSLNVRDDIYIIYICSDLII